MIQGIDHLVIMVADLEVAAENYRQLGFTVVPGGRHNQFTHNALVGLADGAYLELIAFYEPDEGHRWWRLLQMGGGLVDVCLQTDDLAGDSALLRQAGVTMVDVGAMSRLRPDGVQLDWVLSAPDGRFQGQVPFLIEDVTPRSERVPQEIVHANGVVGIAGITAVVPDLMAAARWYEHLLHSPGEPVERMDLGVAGLRFHAGPHQIDLVEAAGGTLDLRAQFQQRGTSLYDATFKTTAVKAGALESSLTLGMRARLVAA